MFARTDRLLLRPGWIEDAPALARAMNDEGIARNLAHAPWPNTLGDAEAFLSGDAGPLPRLTIFLRTMGAPRLVGGIGLHEGPDGGVELGYWIARPYWGLGFATEAGRAMVDLAHASLRIPRLGAGHMIDNPQSGRVLRKLGFQPTGRTALRPCRARAAEVPSLLYERNEGDVAPGQDMRALAA